MDILDTIIKRNLNEEVIYKIELLEMAKEMYNNESGLTLEQILFMVGSAYHAGRYSAFMESETK